MSQQIFAAATTAREKFDALSDRMSALGVSEAKRTKLATQAIAEMRPQTRAKLLQVLYEVNAETLAKMGIRENDWREHVLRSDPGSIPSLDLLLEILTEYTKRISSASRGSLKQSDGADMLHAMYLPHVDLFRADGSFAELLRPIAHTRGYQIVKRLEHLPEAVQRLEKSSG